MKKLYRYEIEYTNEYNSQTNVYLKEYQVVRETESYYFIVDDSKYVFGDKKYNRKIKKNAYNTFAYDDKSKAMQHFKRRTAKRISWYKYWIEQCENALEIVDMDLLLKGQDD